MRELFEKVYVILKRVSKISTTEFSVALGILIKSVKNR